MKKNKIVKYLIALTMITGSLAFITGCDHEDNPSLEPDQEEMNDTQNASLSGSLAEEDVEIISQAMNESSDQNGKTQSYFPCAVITRDEDQKILTIDFGDGCTGPFGRQRSGKIIVHFSGIFDDLLANRIITFDNYVVNNKAISGSIELRDVNRNLDGFITATRRLKDYTVTFPNKTSIVMNGEHTRIWIAGEGDGLLSTNVFQLTGYFEAVSTHGRSFTQTIVDPVIANFNCKSEGGFLRTSGTIEWKYSGEAMSRVRTVNYGSGECDNSFTVTINGRVFTITEE